ncbi:putative quinol monooxygenase [Sphingomonas koreensis]
MFNFIEFSSGTIFLLADLYNSEAAKRSGDKHFFLRLRWTRLAAIRPQLPSIAGILGLRSARFRSGEAPMLKVIAQDFIKPEAVEVVLPLYRELVEETRREALCIAYDLFIDQKDPGHFIFIEEWPDRAALDAHCRSEHFTRLVPLINAHQRQEATFILMDAFPPSGFDR